MRFIFNKKKNTISDEPENFILHGDIIYSSEDKGFISCEGGYAVCEKGISKGVFKEIPVEYKGYKLYDYGESLIFPGLIDLHTHAAQYRIRSAGMDVELLDWLDKYAFPEEAEFSSDEYARAVYSAFSDEMRRGATSRACVWGSRHSSASVILADEMEKSGLKSFVGKVNMDRNAPDYLSEHSAAESAKDTISWLDAFIGRKYGNTYPIVTPRFIPSCSDDLMYMLGCIRRKYSLPVQSHLSENPSEIEFVKKLCPSAKYYGDAYDKHGLFGEDNTSGQKYKTVMAHCVYSSEEEIEKIKENGVFIAHCPSSNLNVKSGIAPVRKYISLGLNVGLGTDIAGGETLSMFNAIKDAVKSSKVFSRYIDSSAEQLSFSEAFYLATRGGGKFFGKAGAFDSGYEFDAVVLNDSEIRAERESSLEQRLERAVYLNLDLSGRLSAKFVAGKRVFPNMFYEET